MRVPARDVSGRSNGIRGRLCVSRAGPGLAGRMGEILDKLGGRVGACDRRAPSGLGNACEWANRSNPNKVGTRRDRTSRTRTASRGIVSVRATPEHTAAKLAYTAKELLESVEI